MTCQSINPAVGYGEMTQAAVIMLAVHLSRDLRSVTINKPFLSLKLFDVSFSSDAISLSISFFPQPLLFVLVVEPIKSHHSLILFVLLVSAQKNIAYFNSVESSKIKIEAGAHA